MKPIVPTTAPAVDDREYTGGSVSYYSVLVERPTTKGRTPYIAECNDIIEALNMNSAQGNIFKAVWRMCAARKGLGKKGYTDGLYDAEKIVFFGEREVVREAAERAVAMPPPLPKIAIKTTTRGDSISLSKDDFNMLLARAGVQV